MFMQSLFFYRYIVSMLASSRLTVLNVKSSSILSLFRDSFKFQETYDLSIVSHSDC